MSFHLPLHRYFAVFMCQAVRQQGATLNDLLPPTDMLHLLMMHPLRVQVSNFFIFQYIFPYLYLFNIVSIYIQYFKTNLIKFIFEDIYTIIFSNDIILFILFYFIMVMKFHL